MFTPDGKPAQLKQYTKCPTCGCSTVKSITIKNQHCNGYWNESLYFDCGMAYTFSPNYMTDAIESPCTRNKQYEQQVESNRTFIASLFSKINDEKTISERLRKQCLSSLQYVTARD